MTSKHNQKCVLFLIGYAVQSSAHECTATPCAAELESDTAHHQTGIVAMALLQSITTPWSPALGRKLMCRLVRVSGKTFYVLYKSTQSNKCCSMRMRNCQFSNHRIGLWALAAKQIMHSTSAPF